MKLSLVLLISTLPALAASPNIVLIVSDDQGWNDVSFHGGSIRTPHIDRIAREGVELDRFYVGPVCSPTRAGMMTGRYPIRFGMQRAVCRPFLDVGVPPGEETLAEMLGRAGYRHRAAIGKWHIGHSRKRYHPLRQGFTFYLGHYNGNIDYFSHVREGELDWHRGFDPDLSEGYSTDLIADEAVRFIKKRAGGSSPFFLYVPFNAPHAPLQVPERWLDDYAGEANPDRRTYMAMVAAMDSGIGRILDALEEADVARDTLVWFTSDNGGAREGDNRPLRAGKGTLYEGGIRVAAALRWPAGIEGGGRRVRGMLTYLDVWPTLARVAGLASPQGPGRPLDGVDALDVIRGKTPAPKRPFFSYFERYQGERLALIEGDWKLVRNGPPILGPNPADQPPAGMKPPRPEALTVELFRLDRDPGEKRDLAAEHTEQVARMLKKLKRFRRLRPAGGVPPMTAPPPPGWKAPKQWTMTEE